MVKVVISGSFHRDLDKLQLLFKELETNGCRILSPISLEFEVLHGSFVKSSTETDLTVAEIEKYHLRAIREADLLWLHAPNGYVGISGSYELGFAGALHKPIFCRETLQDEMLQTRVRAVNSVFEALNRLY